MNTRWHQLILCGALAALTALTAPVRVTATAQTEPYRVTADRLIDAAVKDSAAWNKIAELTDTFGHRLSGSAIARASDRLDACSMRADGLENVRGEPVMVPHWVRGAESRRTGLAARASRSTLLGLGGASERRPRASTAPVLVVDELRRPDQRMLPKPRERSCCSTCLSSVTARRCVYRAASARPPPRKVGALRHAASVRRVVLHQLAAHRRAAVRHHDHEHPRRRDHRRRRDADAPHAEPRSSKSPYALVMNARTLPDAPSRNVVAELRGRELPDEVVVIGGHIDSWDVGQGAMDDAGGVVAAWEAVRLMKSLGIRPRRTVRVVGWTNEENGTPRRPRLSRGPRRRARQARLRAGVATTASSVRTASPRSAPTPRSRCCAASRRLLQRIGADSRAARRRRGGHRPAPRSAGVPGAGLDVDGTRYFWFHHSNADTPTSSTRPTSRAAWRRWRFTRTCSPRCQSACREPRPALAASDASDL